MSRRHTSNPFAGLGKREQPSTPQLENGIGPSTPTVRHKARVSLVNTPPPSTLPSLSASVPFDWQALRNGRPIYSTPPQRQRHSVGVMPMSGTQGNNKNKTTKPRAVRRASWIERVSNLPAQIWFDIQLLPQTLPLPDDKTIGRSVGGVAHFIHFLCRWRVLSGRRDEDIGWEDMYDDQIGWFHWATLLGLLVATLSLLGTFYLFTRIRVYRIHHHRVPGEQEPRLVNSPRARFVDSIKSTTLVEPPPPWIYALILMKRALSATWHFLLGSDIAALSENDRATKSNEFQELEVWFPNETEKSFFSVYSPVHALLWYVWGFHNWLGVFAAMGVLTMQITLLITTFDGLLKDRLLLSAEAFNEYDQKFVNPRLFPIRHDVGTQTHEAEVITERDWAPVSRNGKYW